MGNPGYGFYPENLISLRFCNPPLVTPYEDYNVYHDIPFNFLINYLSILYKFSESDFPKTEFPLPIGFSN